MHTHKQKIIKMHLGCLAWSQRLSDILQAAEHASSSWNVTLERGSRPATTLYSRKGPSSDGRQMLLGSQPHPHGGAALAIEIHYEKNH